MYTVRARVFDAHNFIILVLARSKHIQQHTATKPKSASDIIPRGTTRCEVFRFAGARGDDNYCVLSIEGHNDGDSIARTRPSRLSLRYARRYQLLRGVIVQKPHVQQCHEMTRDQGKISFFFFFKSFNSKSTDLRSRRSLNILRLWQSPPWQALRAGHKWVVLFIFVCTARAR